MTHLTRIVRNKSSRNGARILLGVLHTTEGHERPGVSDLTGLASWFDNPASQASSHVGNDAEGNDIRMVNDQNKAWTCAGYNSVSVNLEQIGLAAETRAQWLAQPKQLENTAWWVAHWSELHGIPIRQGQVNGGRVIRTGFVQHSQLGTVGGGHHDCGPGFPMDHVLDLARRIVSPKPDRELVEARARLKRVRAEIARRPGKRSPGLRALANKLKAFIRRTR